MNILRLFTEALLVGIGLVVLGYIVMYTAPSYFNQNPACVGWNDNHIFEYTLFVTGFLGHLLCEATGLNRWYCRSGVACTQ